MTLGQSVIDTSSWSHQYSVQSCGVSIMLYTTVNAKRLPHICTNKISAKTKVMLMNNFPNECGKLHNELCITLLLILEKYVLFLLGSIVES